MRALTGKQGLSAVVFGVGGIILYLPYKDPRWVYKGLIRVPCFVPSERPAFYMALSEPGNFDYLNLFPKNHSLTTSEEIYLSLAKEMAMAPSS